MPGGGNANRGQPTTFNPGTTNFVVAVGLKAGTTTTWSVKSGGVVRKASAKLSSPLCGATPPPPQVMASGGSIGSKVTLQQYAADHITLVGAAVKMKVVGLSTTCIGGGVPIKPAVTMYVSPVTNGTASGTTVVLGGHTFWAGKGKLTINDPQFVPPPPYTLGMSDGYVAADAYGQCDLGNGVVIKSALVPVPKPDPVRGDADAYCFATRANPKPEVTFAGNIFPAVGPPDCVDVDTNPGGIRWR
jgi:hypothetical protein